MEFLVPLIIAAVIVVFVVAATVRVVPQAHRFNVERFGRYRTTLQPGLNFIVPIADRVRDKLDIREQVFSSVPQPVITEDNVVVHIDTVLYYQITDPRAAAYEVANYLQAIDQLTVTTLRNVIGSMDLEEALTSRESINAQLRSVLDEATGRWGIRVNRVEIKAIDPPNSIKDAMEKQMRAERDKRAAILHAEGERQARILTAEGTRQQEILLAQGDQQAKILRSDGEAKAIERVFQAVHANDADPQVLAYKYLDTLPSLAQGDNNTFFVIPGEFTEAIRAVSDAFGDHRESPRSDLAARLRAHVSTATTPSPETDAADGVPDADRPAAVGREQAPPALDAVSAAQEAAESAALAVRDAKAEAQAAAGTASGDGSAPGSSESPR